MALSPSIRNRGLTVLSIALLLITLLSSSMLAGEIVKIPIEQAIEESQQAHEMCRLAKARALEKARAAGEALGPVGALPTQYQYDVTFYSIALEVNIVTEIIYGEVSQWARATQDGVTFCEIDLFDNLTVDSVKVDGGPGAYTHAGNVITVTLPGTLYENDVFKITTFYHGHPVEGGFQAFAFDSRNSIPIVSTLSEPYFARTWWPCKDYPDDKADSVYVQITYRSDLFCTSNGVMTANIDNLDGTRTTTWEHRYPIATYLVSLAMSDYASWQENWYYGLGESMPVHYWVFPDRLSAAQSGWSATTDMLDTLSDRYGRYPFADEKYAMSMFPWGGAMEHQTNTSMGTYATSQSITVHEMGHQWWGDMITCVDWGHIWLNEGFATYTEALWFESLGGFADLRSYMNNMFYSSGGTIYCQDTTGVWSIFTTRVYDKGAWVLHMLRHVVGDETFFDILHTYYDDPNLKWGAASTEDFRDVCEAVSGIDLHDFFQDWIYGEYYPRYVSSFAYDQLDSDSFRVYVQVRQEQGTSPQTFRMPGIDVSLFDGNSYHDFSVPNESRTQNYIFESGGWTGAPQSVVVDRNDWILKSHRNESYAVHIIYDQVGDGSQFSAYTDSIIVRGGTHPYTFQLTDGALPNGLNLNSANGFVTGSATESGSFSFTVQVTDYNSVTDSKEVSLEVTPASYVYGDAGGDGVTNISDCVYIIAYVFSGGPAPTPMVAGDANGDCVVGVSDVVYLVAYIFGGGPAPVAGCV